MVEIVGIQFRGAGKVYSFTPNGLQLPVGTGVIVETAQGEEYGLVVSAVREEQEENLVSELKPVVRIATEEDLNKVKENAKREEEAYAVCEKKIAEHELDMKLVEVELAFDQSKMLFYFTSEGRVDFRELVKDLASTFHTRIELRQIGVRDEARALGGLGICGRPFCCSSFLADFQPVSIKMAKEQGLSLNPTKISGTCGRLMCCLKYEQEAYEDLIRRTAPIGSYVSTPDGNGYVADYHLLTGILKIKLDSSADGALRSFKNCDVTILQRPDKRKDKKNDKAEKQEKTEKVEKTEKAEKIEKVEPVQKAQEAPVKKMPVIHDATLLSTPKPQPAKTVTEQKEGENKEENRKKNFHRRNNKKGRPFNKNRKDKANAE